MAPSAPSPLAVAPERGSLRPVLGPARPSACSVWLASGSALLAAAALAACPPEGGGLAPVPGDQTRIAVARFVSDDGAFFSVVWRDGRSLSTTGHDIWANSTGPCVQDDPAGGRPVCTDASAQDAPAIATTGFVLGGVNPPPYPATFGAIIGWQDARNGDLDIYARRDGGDRRLGGAWDTVAVAICTATGNQTDVSVAGSDPRGAAAFAWVDRRNGDADIFAAHVDSTGTPTWAVDGNPVCTAAGDQTDVRIFPLLDGGFLLCWLDGRAAPAL